MDPPDVPSSTGAAAPSRRSRRDACLARQEWFDDPSPDAGSVTAVVEKLAARPQWCPSWWSSGAHTSFRMLPFRAATRPAECKARSEADG